ncbi:MAG TPA: RNB domain-containing ribonuclease [Thermoanaerobaculia bacterium]
MSRHRNDLEAIARRVMTERGFLPDFSEAARREARRTAEGDRIEDGPGVQDLRGLLWFSIDNADTRDLDQLTVAERLDNGGIRLRVAIADVDAFVPARSAIEEHAHHNTTSIYTAARTFPMLPEELSTDATSLVEGEDRLAMVVEMVIAEDGSTDGSDIYRARVRNHAKLVYQAVGDWLEGADPLPEKAEAVPGIAEQLRLNDEAADRLRRRRHERGALNFDTSEVRPVFHNGSLADLAEERKDRAKEMIEDFMITANGLTASFLESRGLPSLRRVVRTPRRWPRIVSLARGHGTDLPPDPSPKALAAFLEERRKADPEGFPELSLSVVKLLGSGEYTVDQPGQPSPGHFGLAADDYTHSTAPNRRYPDLVTQRMLKAALAGLPCPYDAAELEELAVHCTVREDEANKVERQVRKSAAALLIAPRIDDWFDAIVTGASEKGTWVRTSSRPIVEGRVVHGHHGLDVGDRVRVRLVSTDVERGFIDFVR